MNLALLAPLGLLALGALLLPLLLHLARRTPQRRTEFAALRWLAARLRPRRRIRVEEPWLLLLRLLLVACVALLFARPVWTVRDAGAPWVLVHPSLAPAQARLAIDCPDDCEWRWLAPGFPTLEETAPTRALPVASLLREADAQLPTGTRLVVAVPAELDGLDAQRPRLARGVEWRVLPGVARAPAATRAPALRVALRGAADAEGARYLRAAARANGWRLDEATGAVPVRANTDVVFWLDATPAPAALEAWMEDGGTLWMPTSRQAAPNEARAAWRDDSGALVATVEPRGRGRRLQWQAPLRPEDFPLLLDADFARGIADSLRPAAAAPTRARAEAWQPRTGGARYEPTPRPLDAWLVALAIVLFALERGWATRRARSLPA